MSQNQNPIVLYNNIEVDIFNEDKVKIGYAPSLAKAARMCYIHSAASIWSYLYKANKVREKPGVSSRITGKRFHFKLKQQ